jgi:hypothetical protein
MTHTPVLQFPDFSQQITLETDAWDSGVGAVLMQKDRPISYLSKALSTQHQ